MVIGFMEGIVVLCHRTKARLVERLSRHENPSPLLDDDAFLPFQGKGVDSSASSALTAQDVFCRPDQCSLTNSYVDNNSSLVSE
jgi:hypothetical protein